ncbi:hypothetical protein BD410DRAFT_155850 [Rickenella mellea]|uniref:Uncharacterized protein n=1 Tax=Rickenella mellea TaxID=50990 RepID=A0A4Y7PJ62_9AGAM|nr:hypothetical protein BD410DRAFT_155850 [Rickenella mellea]
MRMKTGAAAAEVKCRNERRERGGRMGREAVRRSQNPCSSSHRSASRWYCGSGVRWMDGWMLWLVDERRSVLSCTWWIGTATRTSFFCSFFPSLPPASSPFLPHVPSRSFPNEASITRNPHILIPSRTHLSRPDDRREILLFAIEHDATPYQIERRIRPKTGGCFRSRGDIAAPSIRPRYAWYCTTI